MSTIIDSGIFHRVIPTDPILGNIKAVLTVLIEFGTPSSFGQFYSEPFKHDPGGGGEPPTSNAIVVFPENLYSYVSQAIEDYEDNDRLSFELLRGVLHVSLTHDTSDLSQYDPFERNH